LPPFFSDEGKPCQGDVPVVITFQAEVVLMMPRPAYLTQRISAAEIGGIVEGSARQRKPVPSEGSSPRIIPLTHQPSDSVGYSIFTARLLWQNVCRKDLIFDLDEPPCKDRAYGQGGTASVDSLVQN
jgi:hypothetical protein